MRQFKPDLIIVSVLESTYYLAIELLRSIPENKRNYKTLFGGVFATYASDKVIKNDLVDYVCRGEGEGAIVEMCSRLINNGRIDDIKNFTIKHEGKSIETLMRAPQLILMMFRYQIGIYLKKVALQTYARQNMESSGIRNAKRLSLYLHIL